MSEVQTTHDSTATEKRAPDAHVDSTRSTRSNMSASKRKRDPADQDGPASSAKRSSYSKRGAAPPDAPSSDLNESSFLSTQNHSSGGTGEDNMAQSSTTSLDFDGLPHNSGDPSSHQNGAHNPNEASQTAAAALAGIFPNMTVPQPTELSFASSTSQEGEGRNLDPSFNMGDHGGQHDQGHQGFDLEAALTRENAASGREPSSASKPAVGTDEWHRVRRDNHKEVERRRRETINEGINELAKIVPGCERNKGSILQRAVAFITQLKENEAQNIEKWTLEKLLTEQAIAELSATSDKYKGECERAYKEAEHWKAEAESWKTKAEGAGAGDRADA